MNPIEYERLIHNDNTIDMILKITLTADGLFTLSIRLLNENWLYQPPPHNNGTGGSRSSFHVYVCNKMGNVMICWGFQNNDCVLNMTIQSLNRFAHESVDIIHCGLVTPHWVNNTSGNGMCPIRR